MTELLGGLIGIGKKVASGLFGDKEQEEKFSSAYEIAMLTEGSAIVQKELEAKTKIILAESQGDKWQRRWRPTLMYACIAIIVNNYILQPYLAAIFNWSVTLDLPDKLWTLMTVGVGGYITSRGVEKIVKTRAQNGK